MRLAAAAACLTLIATPAAAEKRCGWLVNPTPANWWLNDRDGQWILSVQGRGGAPGFDDLPDMSLRGWVRTGPGSYGHGCACLDLTVDRGSKRVLRIASATPLPLAACRNDPALARVRPD
jgi:hypothetical protein